MILETKTREKLKQCRNFNGNPADFWQQYASLLAEVGDCEKVCVLNLATGGKWQAIAAHPAATERFQMPIALGSESFETWVEEANTKGAALREADPVRQGSALLMPLDTGSTQETYALFHDPLKTADSIGERVPVLQTLADVPASFLRSRQLRQALDDVRHSIQTLDTLNVINSQTRFYAMAMALCNEVKDRFKLSRASLGYFKDPYVRVQAISNMDRFEPKMDVVQQLEATMEEAVDQDEDILYPGSDENSGAITREHQGYAESEGSAFLLTMPLRLGETIVGALCFERGDRTFNEQDIRALRVLCDQVARRIHDLREADRWFGARLARSVRQFFGGYLGYTHTWRKVFAILGTVIFLGLVFIKMEYRVEAPCILRSSELVHLPAPFDGFIEDVTIKVGDLVDADEVLLRLDTSELLVQRANRIAEIQRFSSQAENAEAEQRLAELRIATAQRQQSEAALELIEFQLARAEVRAPFDGVIVEGDLSERIGAPVEKGENLMRLSRLEDLYVEMRVDERDLADIQDSTTGEFALASKPDEHFDLRIERIEPVAIAEAKGSVFKVRGVVEAEAREWWRPGMSGVAKINTGKRRLIWIFTHRLIDFLRLHLWW